MVLPASAAWAHDSSGGSSSEPDPSDVPVRTTPVPQDDAAWVLAVGVPLLLGAVAWYAVARRRAARGGAAIPLDTGVRRLGGPGVVAADLLGLLALGVGGVLLVGEPLPAQAVAGEGVCPSEAPVESFDIHAIQVDTVYNSYGQHDPDGAMYVLAQDEQAVKNAVASAASGSIASPNPDATTELVQPLAIRANVGDCVQINFTNELNEHASIHPAGLSVDPASDGTAVGSNPDSAAAPGETVSYTWYAEREGTVFFGDGADQASITDPEGKGSLRERGLFGALIVEGRGADWLDPETGEPLASGVQAMIAHPGRPDFREFVIFYHDDADVVNADGSTPTNPLNGEEQSLYTMNYRGDPTSARLAEDCPDCADPEMFYSSWVHGDPGGGDLVFPAYLGDPVVFRTVGGQVEENHVHHLHGHRWKSTEGDADSNTIDSQTVAPGATYEQEVLAGFGDRSARPNMTYEEAFASGGAGYAQGSPGDHIFHCHLFPHYASGMWANLRVFDKAQPDLMSLPDRDPAPQPTAEEPGFPEFVPGQYGQRPPKPPDPDLRSVEPGSVEDTALDGSGTPGVDDGPDPVVAGAPYADPCPADAPVRTYDIVSLQKDIVYNKAGDHDPKGRMYALAKDEQAIRDGRKRTEPLAIRAHVGDCVEISLTNKLPPDDEPNEMSMHIHFVGFDALGSDGLANGYNYDQGAQPGETIRYRWYADEQGNIFWHDHFSGLEKGMHGTFGALVVEPKGTEWLHPKTKQPIDSGTKALITHPEREDFREFVLFYQDFVRLRDQNGDPINPPDIEPGMTCKNPWCFSLEDHGTMAINYRNAPLYHRDDADPAYAFSSWVHGDPLTPTLETYAGDSVRIRLLQAMFEEQHNFSIGGGPRWQQEPFDNSSPDMAAQTIGTSEQFEFHIEPNPAGLSVRDFLYGSMPIDDVWNGTWGIFRVWNEKVDHLPTLPDRGGPGQSADQEQVDNQEQAGETGGDPPPKDVNPGDPCPPDAPTRTFDVVAQQRDISYNAHGDHDPHGIVFSLAENADDAGPAEPLVVRANAGDCIELTLENRLPDSLSGHDDHARVPVDDGAWSTSNRVSLMPQKLETASGSGGVTVGFGFDQSVAPGESITYRWYADKEVGTTILKDMADVRNHPHHGAYGLLITEPPGSTYRDPATGEPLRSGAQADIIVPEGEDFREFALAMTDKTYVVNPSGKCVTEPAPESAAAHEADESLPCNQRFGDPEDQGFKGVNYRAEPFTRRFAKDPREHKVFSSKVHGDPATPTLRAYTGDPVRVRLAQPADSPRGITFHLAGHLWPHFWTEPGHDFEGVDGEGMTPGEATTLDLLAGAGGLQARPGDYLYQAMKLRGYLEGGLWGIFRVLGQGTSDLFPLPDRDPPPGWSPPSEPTTGPAGKSTTAGDETTAAEQTIDTAACPDGEVPEDGFADVAADNVHEAAVDCLAWWELTQGTGDGYGPALSVTRAQMASFITRLLESAGVDLDAGTDRFADDDGNVHESAINKLAEADVVHGVSAERYGPQGRVTRAQMASFIVRAHALASGELPPAGTDHFADDDGSVHEASINRAAELGFTRGTGPDTYEPRHPVRRDQMASFLTRLMDRMRKDAMISVTP